MKQDRVLSLLGLAKKAGKIADGSFAVRESGISGRAYLIVAAEDVSEPTRKKLNDMCSYYEIPLCFYGTKETLGAAIGKEFRAAAAVEDQGLADLIRKAVGSFEPGQQGSGRQEE